MCRPPVSTSRSPIPSATPSQNPATWRLSQEAPDNRISTPASSISQIRGTPNRIVGCTSARFCWTVSIDSAKLSDGPLAAIVHVEKIRSVELLPPLGELEMCVRETLAEVMRRAIEYARLIRRPITD